MAFRKLGDSLQGSLHSLQDVVSRKLGTSGADVKARDDQVNVIIKEIERTLVTADVDAKIVRKLSGSIRQQIQQSFDACARDGFQHKNTGRLIQERLFRELVKLVSPPNSSTSSGIANDLLLSPPSAYVAAAAPAPGDGKRPLPASDLGGGPRIVMLVGLQGSGKTTSIAKLAYFFKRQQRKVALVGADTYRAGAHEQLKQNAIKVGVPFYGNTCETDPAIVAAAGCELFARQGYDTILVDTSGRHMQSEALFEEMRQVARAIRPTHTLLVLDALNGQSARDHATAFAEAIPLGGIILTKMDGSAKGGGALSAIASTKARVLFVGMGEHMDQLEPFDPAGFIGRLLGMGDLKSLTRKFEEAQAMLDASNGSSEGEGGAMEMLQMLQTGKPLTLRHFYTQMQLMNNLGSLQSVLEMAGLDMGKMFSLAHQTQQGGGRGDEKKRKQNAAPSPDDLSKSFKLWTYALDSANRAELDMTSALWRSMPAPERTSRIHRITRGSGTTTEHFERLLAVFAQLSNVMNFKKLGGKLGGKGGGHQQQGLQDLVSGLMNGAGGGAGRGGAGGQRSKRKVPGGELPPNLSSVMNALGGGGGGGAGLSALLGGAGGGNLAGLMKQLINKR
jgi:signal recognition particle subunit SRP54